MNKKKIMSLLKVLGIYLLVSVIFHFVGGEQLRFKYVGSTMPQTAGVLEELTKEKQVSESFTVTTETLDAIDILFATYGRSNAGTVQMELLDTNGTVVASHQAEAAELIDNTSYRWQLTPELAQMKGKSLTLQIRSDCVSGAAPTIYYAATEGESFQVGEEARSGQLCMEYTGKHYFMFGLYYWYVVFAVAVLIVAYAVWTSVRESKGKLTLGLVLTGIWSRYGFLINQLVSRDFKTKYKRSVLGYLWSFLNPLLTMMVQYIVFSTIFRSGIENFPVYLLSGIILFNFFTDAVGQGLLAIVCNSSLITKVYVPKYIYPVTKVVSCSINLVISVIPLIIVTLLTGGKITLAILLLPYALLCLLVFCIGMSLLLCTTHVFFRDTSYLWGIVSLVWTYATPLFYPETIIPAKFRFIQTLNPMYHYIKFVRTIFINGVSPDPEAYLVCGLSALAMCVFGAVVFKKFQDKFVLYI